MNPPGPLPATACALPPTTLWAAACRDFEQGSVRSTRWEVGEGSARAYLTRTFIAGWRLIDLPPLDRRRVEHAFVMIAHGRRHPMLPVHHPLPDDPQVGMVQPVEGVCVSFRPHWAHPDQMVFLTISPAR